MARCSQTDLMRLPENTNPNCTQSAFWGTPERRSSDPEHASATGMGTRLPECTRSVNPAACVASRVVREDAYLGTVDEIG